MDLGTVTSTETRAAATETVVNGSHRNTAIPEPSVNRISTVNPTTPSDNLEALTLQGQIAVVRSADEIHSNAKRLRTEGKNLQQIFSGSIKSRPHIRREDLRAKQIDWEDTDYLYQPNGELNAYLGKKDSINPETNIKAALVHGPLGANARDLVLRRSIANFNQEDLKDASQKKSNIVIFCSTDIACDDTARRMISLLAPEDRLKTLAAMRVIRSETVINNYEKLETDNDNEPKIFFVNAHNKAFKAKVKNTDNFETVSKKLEKLTQILKLDQVKYLCFCQAHEITTSSSENVLDYLIRTIKPQGQKEPLEILGVTYFKPQRGDKDDPINLEAHFPFTTYVPGPNQLISSGKMPGLDERKTKAYETDIGESRTHNDKTRIIELKTDYTRNRDFLSKVINLYTKSFDRENARNIISIERDRKSLTALTKVLKKKKLPFVVLNGKGVTRFDTSGKAHHNDFKTRIEAFDKLGKDYHLLVHYDDPLASGLEIPVDNEVLLCLPDSGDDRTEAAISKIRTPYLHEDRKTRSTQRGLIWMERSETARGKKQPISYLINTSIGSRHDAGKESEGRFIDNGHDAAFSDTSTKLEAPVNVGEVLSIETPIVITVEDKEWFEFIGSILGVKKGDNYNEFAQEVVDEIDIYSEVILGQLKNQFLDEPEAEAKIRIADIIQGKEPYDPLKRAVLQAFIGDERKFTEAVAKFPHIIGIETAREAARKVELEIQEANLQPEFNGEWLAELDKSTGNRTRTLVGAFLLERANQYGMPLSNTELLQNALRVILGGHHLYNSLSENAQNLFQDFYTYVNAQYPLTALRVNQILTRMPLGEGFKIDFGNSINLNRPNDLYNNILVALEDKALFKNQAALNLLDQALGIKTLPDKNPLRARLLSDYIQHSPLAIGYIHDENIFRNLIATLLGNSPNAEYINSLTAKNIFNDFINFINSQAELNKIDAILLRKVVPELFNGPEITDLDSAKKRVRLVAAHSKPPIEPNTNWASLCSTDASSKKDGTLDLIAEFLFERQRSLMLPTNEKLLRKAISLLACYTPATNGVHANGEQIPVDFDKFCEWLNQRKPNLHPIQILRHISPNNATYYKAETRITNPEQALTALKYVMGEATTKLGLKPNNAWLEYLDTLEAGRSHLDLFAEYFLSLRTAQPKPTELFDSFENLRSNLSMVSGNGHSHGLKTQTDPANRLTGFINSLTAKYGNRFDIVKVRAWFPEYVEFRQTIETAALLKTTISNLLNKIFPTIENYPKFLERFKTEGNTQLAKFLVNFLIPKYKAQIDSIQNENELNKLLRSLLGQIETGTGSPENTMMRGFVDHLLQNHYLDITEARVRFPKQVSFAETITRPDLAIKTVLTSLNKVNSKVKPDDRPKTLLKLSITADSQGQLAETIVNFLIPKYQGLFNQTADEAALETLLEFMLGINKKVPIQVNEKTLIENFIKHLIQDQKLSVIEARSIFPGYISFAETIATEGLATKTILNSLNDKIFTLAAPYSDFVKKLFANNPSNPKIAELVAKFLIPRYQNQIQNEASLEKLLQLMLKQNRNPATQSPETVIAKAFIEQMIQDQRIDIRDARSFFPEYISFADTVRTKDLAKKAINRSLDKIFSKRDYPRFWETIIDGELNNEKLAEFLVNFFFTFEHQDELQQIQNEEAFEQLLQSMLGLNKALQEEDPRTPLIQSFIDLVLEQKPEEINYVSLHPFYPHILDMSRETASFRLPPDEQLSLYTDIIKLLILENQSEIEQNTKWINFLDLAINNGEALTGENSFPGYLLSTRSNVLADFLMKEHPEYLENDEELLRALGILLGVDVFIQNHPELTKTLIESLDQYLSNSINPARAGFRKEALSIFFPKQFPLTKEDLLKSLENIFIDLFIEDRKRIRENGFNKATVTSEIHLAHKLAEFIYKEFELNTKSAIQLLGKKPIEHAYHLEAYKDFLKRELVKNSGHAINQQTHEWLNALKLPLDEHQLKLTAMQTLLNESEDLTYLESLNRRYTFKSNDGDFSIKTFCECYLDRMVCFSWAENKSQGTKRTYNIKDNGWKLTEEVNLTNIDELPAYTKDYKFR